MKREQLSNEFGVRSSEFIVLTPDSELNYSELRTEMPQDRLRGEEMRFSSQRGALKQPIAFINTHKGICAMHGRGILQMPDCICPIAQRGHAAACPCERRE